MAGHRIDVHHHFYPPDLKDVLGGGPTKTWTPQVSLDEMDAGEVASVALSASSIPTDWWRQDNAWLRRTVRRFNEYGAEMVKDKPGRFALFALLSMRDVEGTMDEIAHAFDTLNADGVGMATNFGDKWPGDPEYAPIFDELERRGALVYIHPTVPFCCEGLLGVSSSLIEYPQDTARAILSLLLSGTFVRCRNIRFVFCHAGGVLPSLTGRIEWGTERIKEMSQLAPDGYRAEIARLHFDTATSGNMIALGALRAVVPDSQILLGSDFPYGSLTGIVEDLQTCGLSAESLAAIERENALRLVPRLKG
ncbi:MAG: putative TIM-barrel fold metal-dependent hydrolase [Alphaproteobacteria bacterium]|jgi:predicted TIM-barrel fold metal-dependent hydrolase